MGEQIAHLRFPPPVEQTFRHERSAGGLDFDDGLSIERDVLSIQAPQQDELIVFLDEKPAERTGVAGFNQIVFVTLPNLRARIDYIQEQPIDIVALIRREVGADAAALAEKRVTRRAGV